MTKEETLLCKREFGGEYFFLPQTGDKLKLRSEGGVRRCGLLVIGEAAEVHAVG